MGVFIRKEKMEGEESWNLGNLRNEILEGGFIGNFKAERLTARMGE